MTRKNGKRLVIDANIAHSAGAGEVPDSRYSRNSLEAVLDGDHVAVLNQTLRKELKGHHSSKFFRIWWRSMAARRRFENAEGEEFVIHLDRACSCLEQERWKKDLIKDFHLVRSALATDQTIISNEKNLPHYLLIACQNVPLLSTLYYANPTAEGEKCILWIKAGAEKEADRCIDTWTLNHLKAE